MIAAAASRIGFCIGHTFSREPIKPKTAEDFEAGDVTIPSEDAVPIPGRTA